MRRFLLRASVRSTLVPSLRSMVLALVDSFAIAAPKGRKSFTIVWSINTLRSARNRMRLLPSGFHARDFHKRQMIWNAVLVFPLPVRPFCSTAPVQLTLHHDLTVGDLIFLPNLHHFVPPGALD